MKKYALSLIACLGLMSSINAAESPLGESLHEFETLITAISIDPVFSDVIPASQFITKIKRITRRVNIDGEVRYKIVTKEPYAGWDPCHKHHDRRNAYIATVEVAVNPGVGPKIVTVVSLVHVGD